MSTEREARTVGLDDLVGRLRSAVTDYDGAPMADGEAPRDDLTCLDLRRASKAIESANKRAEYWKAEHLAGNAEIERLREQLTRLACALYDQIDNRDAQEHYREQIAALRPNDQVKGPTGPEENLNE